MKERILVAMVIAVASIFYACSKNTTEPELEGVVAKLQGKWMITGYINDSGQETCNSLPACEKDNSIIYDRYNVSVDEGLLKCDSTDPQFFSSSFALKSNGFDILTYTGNEGDDLDDMQIISVDVNTLKLKDASSNMTITYTKVPKIIVYSQASIVDKWKLSSMVEHGVNVWNLPVGSCAKGSNGNVSILLLHV